MNVILYGLQVALIGISVVFVGLALLILSISIMAWVFKKINANKAAKAEDASRAEAAAKAAAPAPVPVQEPAPVEEEVQDAQLIAVIAAAIAAFDNSGKQLVVRKVRRVSGWNRSAREEQVYRF